MPTYTLSLAQIVLGVLFFGAVGGFITQEVMMQTRSACVIHTTVGTPDLSGFDAFFDAPPLPASGGKRY